MILRSLFFALLLVAAAVPGLARPETSGPDPDAIVRKLYKEHNAEEGPFFDKENRAVLAQYFTNELVGLIAKDAAAAKGEVGAIEFDPLYESQDPQITNLKIGRVNWGGILKHEGDEAEEGLAVVLVTFKNSGKAHTITFRFHQTARKTWKIADINYSDGSSMVGLLRGDGVGPNGGNQTKPDAK